MKILTGFNTVVYCAGMEVNMRRWLCPMIVLSLACVLCHAEEEKGEPVMDGSEIKMLITSTAFGNHDRIPVEYTGDGEDISPALTFSGVPDVARELVLICDDPDAPVSEPWVHWVIYRIPATAPGLSESIPTDKQLDSPSGAYQGENSWGRIGYGGPAPPRGHGVHHYYFKLYALDSELDVKPGMDKNSLLDAMDGHVIAEAVLIGTYDRK